MKKGLLLLIIGLTFSLSAQTDGSYISDYLAVRAVLDSAGLTDISVESVTDSLNQRIVALRLNKRNITCLSNRIGELSALTQLDLSYNSLVSLPSSIGGMQKLQSLKLQFNLLETLPIQITALKRINYLDITYNRLCNLPDSVFKWVDKYAYIAPYYNPEFFSQKHWHWYNSQRCAQDEDTLVVRQILDTNGITNISALNFIMGVAGGRITVLDFKGTVVKNITILPQSIGALDGLVSFSLQNSSVTEIPETIGNLKNLRTLYIQNNKIDSLPSSIGNLTKLRILQLEGNQLRSLPQSIIQLNSLESCSLKKNRLCNLTGTLFIWANQNNPDWASSQFCPDSADNSALRAFLDANGYYTINGHSIAECTGTRITKINLSRYTITDYSALQSLTELSRLIFSSCTLATLPDWIGNFSKLEELSIDYCNITAVPSSIVTLSNLRSLSLNNNRLTVIPDLHRLSRLQYLALGSNFLHSIPDSMYLLKNASLNVSLFNNRICSLSDSNLVWANTYAYNWQTSQLCISNTNDTVILRELITLNNLPITIEGSQQWVRFLNGRVSELQLSGYDLRTLPNSLGQLTELKILNIAYNKIDSLPSSICTLTGLQDLRLNNNNLVTLPDSIVKLSNLTTLYISKNYICNLPASIHNWVTTYCNEQDWLLKQLCIDQNDLAILQEILDTNKIQRPVQDFIKARSLNGRITGLEIYGSAIKYLPGSIQNLDSLHSLKITSHLLNTIPSELFRLVKLDTLDLSYGRITTIPNQIYQLTNLKSLLLYGNKLTTISSNIQNCSQLRELNISNNPDLTTLPNAIGYLANLEVLHIISCKLNTLPESITQLSNLTSLDFRNNMLCNLTNTISSWIDSNTQYTEWKSTQFCLNDYTDTLLVRSILDTNGWYTTGTKNVISITGGEITALQFRKQIGTKFFTCLPPAIAQFSSLKKLVISNNEDENSIYGFPLFDVLSELPMEIYGMSNLDTLEIQYCNIKEIPDEMTQMTHLRRLVLNSDALNSLPDSIHKLDSLTHLNISKNALCTMNNAQNQWATTLSPNWRQSQICSVPPNPVTISAVAQDNNTVRLTWDLSGITTYNQFDINKSRISEIGIWLSTNGYPVSPDQANTVHAGTFPAQLYENCDTTITLSTNTTYYACVFTKNINGVWSTAKPLNQCTFQTFSTPVLKDSLGSASSLNTVDLVRDQHAFTIYYRLFDNGEQFDTVTLFHQIGAGGTVTACQNITGSTGVVPANNASFLRTIRWNAGQQLGNGFESDSIKLVLKAVDASGRTVSLVSRSWFRFNQKQPEPVSDLITQVLNSTTIKASWTRSASTEAESVFVVLNNDTAVTAQMSAAETTVTIPGLVSHVPYTICVYVKDSWNNVSQTACRVDSISLAPVCDLTALSSSEVSDTIEIPFSVSDEDGDHITLQCSYSTDGTSWHNASVNWSPDLVKGSYQGTIRWFSRMDINGVDNNNILFAAVALDVLYGRGDTIRIHVDNNQKQKLILETPKSVQREMISIPYQVIDSTKENLEVKCFFSKDSGKTWHLANNVDKKIIADTLYTNTIQWQTLEDLGSTAYDAVAFRGVLSDGHRGGDTTTTGYFPVNNQGLSLSVVSHGIRMISTKEVTLAIKITSLIYDTISLDSVQYSPDGGSSWKRTSIKDSSIIRKNFDSTEILWPFRTELSGKHTAVRLRLFFSADTFHSIVLSEIFSLSDNQIPVAIIDSVQISKQGDVTAYCSVTDPENNPVSLFMYYGNADGEWKNASLRNSPENASSSTDTKRTLIWPSPLDLGLNTDTIYIKVLPMDRDTGIADSVKLALSKVSVPVIKRAMPIGNPVKDTIRIEFTLLNHDETLNMKLFCFKNNSWIEAGGTWFTIDTTGIGFLYWPSSRVFPDTIADSVYCMVKSSNVSGDYEFQTSLFKIDNTGIFPDYTADFNRDGFIDILDFSYVASSWLNSTKGIKDKNQLAELAPVQGTDPFYTIIPDSIFNYEDLGIFMKMTYWSYNNLGIRAFAVPLLKSMSAASPVNATITHNDDAQVLQINLNEADDVIACRIGVASKDISRNFSQVDLPLFASKGTPVSLTHKNNGIISIEAGIISEECATVTTALPLMNLSFTNQISLKNSTIFYELISSSHQVKTGMIVPVTDAISLVAVQPGIVVLPNPASIATLPQPISPKQQSIPVISSDGGCILQVQLPSGASMYSVSIAIYDAQGTIVRTSGLNSITKDRFYYFWDGYNNKGQRVAGGTYLAMVKYSSNVKSGLFKAKIGIRSR